MKRKIFAVLLILFSVLFCAACSNSSEGTTEENTQTETQDTNSGSTQDNTNQDSTETSKAAVIYFSKTGNTEKIAQMISDSTGAEMIKIEPVNPYPDDYDQTVEIAQEEQNNNARPEIKTSVTDFTNYDTIFFGVPVWWGDLPMPAFTFLDQYDLSGKTIGVFTTHHGSGLGSCVESVEAAEPDANVVEGIDVYDEELDQSKAEVEDWAKSVLDAPKN